MTPEEKEFLEQIVSYKGECTSDFMEADEWPFCSQCPIRKHLKARACLMDEALEIAKKLLSGELG